MRVLVTCPPMLGLFHEFESAFAQHGIEGVPAQVTQIMTEAELKDALPNYDGWIIGDDPATRSVFEPLPTRRVCLAVKLLMSLWLMF